VDRKAAGSDANPNLVPVIFVLSDGKSNMGHSLEEITPTVKELGITINTIGYNADIPALEEISRINEGVNINADTKNVTHELANLFNYAM
jgi:Ca-activated chloride channel family protein